MGEFSITASALGNLSAFYFYSYVAMQIPTGLLAQCFFHGWSGARGGPWGWDGRPWFWEVVVGLASPLPWLRYSFTCWWMATRCRPLSIAPGFTTNGYPTYCEPKPTP